VDEILTRIEHNIFSSRRLPANLRPSGRGGCASRRRATEFSETRRDPRIVAAVAAPEPRDAGAGEDRARVAALAGEGPATGGPGESAANDSRDWPGDGAQLGAGGGRGEAVRIGKAGH
jgi:hypothetical protein